MNRLGLSYACLAPAPVSACIDLCRELGLRLTDIRSGAGQGWKVRDFGRLAEAGIAVVSVNTPVVLGRPVDQSALAEAAALDRVWPAICLSPPLIRVFLLADAEPGAVAGGLGAFAAAGIGPSRIVVETHAGHAPPAEIATVAKATGLGVALDNLGLYHTAPTGTLDKALHALAPLTRVVHVKGHEQAGAHPRHIPLREMPHCGLRAVGRTVSRTVPVLLESKAGTTRADMAVLAAIFGQD